MSICINEKEYKYIEGITIFEFIREYQIFLPSLHEEIDYNDENELCYVEVDGIEELVDAKKMLISEDMVIKTNSKKVYTYLYTYLYDDTNSLKEKFYKKLELNNSDYNVMLCSPECYDECFNLYKEKGFNDIVSSKLFQMVEFTELAHEIMIKISNKLDQNRDSKLLVIEPSIISPYKKIQFNLKSHEEIAAQLIKTYYKETLKIQNNINVIYVTKNIKELICHHTKSNYYISMIDDMILFNNFDIESNALCYDGLFSKEIYKKPSENINFSCDYTMIFKILRQMGLKEVSLEIINNQLGKQIYVSYQGFTINVLFTNNFLTKEQLKDLTYDLILISYKDDAMNINEEQGVLNDYNLNRLYKNVLGYPGYSNIFRKY